MRRLLLRMVLLVVLLHAAAIAVFYLADIEGASRAVRLAFVIAWVTGTFVLVSAFLRRIRLARRGLGVRRR